MIPAYLETLRTQRRLSEKTLRIYEIELNTLDRLNRDRRRIMEHLAQCKPATHSRKLVIWRQYLRSIGDRSLDDLPNPKIRYQVFTFLNEDELTRFKAEALKRSDEDRLFIDLALTLGLRLSEVLQLSSAHLDGEWIRVTRKGGNQQNIPLTEDLKIRLSTFRGFDKCSHYYQNLVRKTARQAGIKKRVTPHTLRHTFATRAMSQGCNIINLRDLLGHRSVNVTNRYCHSNPTDLLNLIRGRINRD